jgi:MFS family permease
MGHVGDRLGRNAAFVITSLLASAGALGSALLPFGGAQQVYLTMAACRFLLGVGLGGCYPLSATKVRR